jgi:hypothetical protein
MAVRYLVHDDKGNGHLPVSDEDGTINHRLMGAAWAALHGGYRGNQYEGPGKSEAIAKLKKLYESEGMELPSETNSELRIQSSEFITHNSELFAFAAPLVSVDGTARIPILVTGTWIKNGKEVTFTLEDLKLAISNFDKLANHDLNVDYDHASEDLQRAEGNPTPSAGRIVALDDPSPFTPPPSSLSPGEREEGKGSQGEGVRWILYGRYEPTARARTLIQNREYRYTSAAFATHYPDRTTGEDQGLTLTSVALTNQPFLDELPEIWLSVAQGSLSSPAAFQLGARSAQTRTAGPESGSCATQNSRQLAARSDDFTSPWRHEVAATSQGRLAAAQGGRTMAKLKLSRAADGTHEVLDADGKQVGTIDHDHLCQYCRTNLADDLKLSAAGTVEGQRSKVEGEALSALNVQLSTFAKEVGAEGKTLEQIRGLVAVALDPPKPEVTLLCEAVGADGKLDNTKLDALDDSGQISRSAWRRAKEAEQRVQNAFSRGQITPAMLATGAPLRLALSDSAAFQALVEDRPSVVKPNTVLGIGGTGAETGESPRQLFSRLVEEKKQQLLQANAKLSELEAHRQASSLVAKENPELLKNYRADAKSA